MKAVLRDAIAVAAIAGVLFQALRHWVADRYVIPSGSMQPTLLGAQHGGDIVLVDKVASAASLRRYDVAVFRLAGDATDLVKRVVAFGDDADACCLELRDGDLWLGPDAQRLERAQKDPIECRDLRVPWLRWPGPAEGFENLLAVPTGAGDPVAGLALPRFDDVTAARAACTEGARRARADAEDGRGDRTGGGWLATLRPVDAGYLDGHGRRGNEGASLIVDDVGADFEVATQGVDAVLCGFDLRPDSWLFCWRPAQRSVELWRNGATVTTHEVPPAGDGAAPTERRRVEYGFLDGRFFFVVDGRHEWVHARPPDWVAADPGPTGWGLPKNRLYLAVVGAQPAPLARLQVFHDVHWYRLPLDIGVDPKHFSPVRRLEPGQVFLLGDNAADSRDSRMFGPVPLQAFVGRPRIVLGPWPRTHWLAR